MVVESCLVGIWSDISFADWLHSLPALSTQGYLDGADDLLGTIFISCLISFASSFWMAAADTWYNLLIARFALGLAVGAKSSTTPVYAAESAPKNIRGALTMMWQMWTAFGMIAANGG